MTFVLGMLFSGFVWVATVEHKCEALNWVVPPAVTAGHFTGTLEDRCLIKSVSNLGFKNLRQYMEKQLPTEAETVHAGPTDTQFKGLPGVQYDVTLVSKNGSVEVRARGDQFFATDEATQLQSAFYSKNVNGTGAGAHLRVTNAEIEVKETPDADWFSATFRYYVKVEKPNLVPVKPFTNQVKQELEGEALHRRPSLVETIGNGI